jgi:hypothetical protein
MIRLGPTCADEVAIMRPPAGVPVLVGGTIAADGRFVKREWAAAGLRERQLSLHMQAQTAGQRSVQAESAGRRPVANASAAVGSSVYAKITFSKRPGAVIRAYVAHINITWFLSNSFSPPPIQ